LNILHVSDVHFGMKDDFGEQGRVAEALITAVHGDGLKPDLCIFSGDLAFSGKAEEFKTGGEWLSRLVRPEWNSKLIIVPGNHDVDRSRANAKLLRTYSSEEIYREIRPRVDTISDHLSEFFTFWKDTTTSLPLVGDWSTNPLGYVHTITTLQVPVHVICLNSALFSCDDMDVASDKQHDNYLVVDVKTLNDALKHSKSNPGLIVAVSHHPIDNLRKWNAKPVEKFLSQQTGAHLFFHGHLHDLSTNFTTSNSGARLTKVAAGAVYQGSAWPQLFSYLTLDFKEHTVTTKAYKFNEISGVWELAPALSWTIRTELPEPAAQKTARAQAIGARSSPSVALRDAGNATPGRSDGGAPIQGTEDQSRHESNDEGSQSSVETDRVSAFLGAAEEIQRRLLPYFDSSPDIRSYQYRLKNRIKSKVRISEKVETRRTVTKSAYSADDLVDICGFRIVTFYQSQIVTILSNMLYTIDKFGIIGTENVDGGTIGNVPVSRDGVEIDVNTNRPEDDPLSITRTIREMVTGCGLAVKVERKTRPTGYSSVHFMCKVTFAPPFAGSIKEMPIEIQIRSALEDVWAELDTQLRFATNRGQVGSAWAKHLNVFKHVIDSLVQYADVIQLHSFDEPVRPPSELKLSRTVTSSNSQLDRVKSLPPPIYKRVQEAYALWEQAEAKRAFGGDPALRREAAQAFMSIPVEFAGALATNRWLEEELNYLVQGESAYMLMYTGGKEDLATAEKIYNVILARRENDATAHFRLGGVHRLQELYEKSLTHLQRALEILNEGKDNRVDKSHWIFDRVRLGIGHTEWRQAQLPDLKRAERIGHLVSAFNIAIDVAHRPSFNQAVDNLYMAAVNDMLYYLYELETFGYDDFDSLIQRSERAKYVEELYNFVDARPECEYHYYDTVLRCVNEDKERAVHIALKLEQQLEQIAKFRKGEDEQVPPKGSLVWVVFVSRLLKDSDEADSFGYCIQTIERFGRPNV
jgi:ppGpp synthetase/RelA/SpoT-type nucleotidyltranferase